ncbi:MAG TPA: type II toxin-antitoxin system VapC family toxin [Rhizomicrobium sp.]|jgi:tRNA(fMet)-specific endonuclease VapC|nr:type II toxin-antitoxin system VapC family toxin [Rhizomicrobium sp.]
MISLDTNAVIGAINGRFPNVRRQLEAALVDQIPIGISVIVVYELAYGIRKSARPQANAAALAAFVSLGLTVWPFEPEDAEEAGEIRAALEAAGTPIGPYDILIAAQSRRRGARLVTANMGEFARVPGLRIENWAQY